MATFTPILVNAHHIEASTFGNDRNGDKPFMIPDDRRDSAVEFTSCKSSEDMEDMDYSTQRTKLQTQVDELGYKIAPSVHIPRLTRRDRRRLRQLEYELRMAWRPIGKDIANHIYESDVLAEVGIPPLAA
ncbi:uncharacterized protein SPPG_07081 [Spizellomyces punctatus DAOM BR117]|uniref:Uncharacterized protein n=1 Tax=Spizellomyces punctatus (strain DAOM BR117) TaxID=645134 RepID=A0A0L0HAB3_SPIPD|nr:uncharacterized protein SPPG_07081 [Spizellomyces punctatus DAOM BR117]KNC97613.1 hypothetical protein SPPG_07081 [Spizellomyces punctatus DAOM BR117]|eukprot:XP_016605653.1 hypothetical protein SPPG_07081 [Spizellomyces punctatus DAOM BR117]